MLMHHLFAWFQNLLRIALNEAHSSFSRESQCIMPSRVALARVPSLDCMMQLAQHLFLAQSSLCLLTLRLAQHTIKKPSNYHGCITLSLEVSLMSWSLSLIQNAWLQHLAYFHLGNLPLAAFHQHLVKNPSSRVLWLE